MEEEEIIKHEQDIDTLSIHELEELILDYKNKINDLEKKIESKKKDKTIAEQFFRLDVGH